MNSLSRRKLPECRRRGRHRPRPDAGRLFCRQRVPLTRRLTPPPHGRRRTAGERRECRRPTRRSDYPNVCVQRHVYRRYEVQIGAGRTTSGFVDEFDMNCKIMRTVEARSAGFLGPPGRRDRAANRVPATTSKTVPRKPSLRGIPPRKTDGSLWASKSVTMTDTLVYKLSRRDSNIVRSTSTGTIRTSCSNCAQMSSWGRRTDSA